MSFMRLAAPTLVAAGLLLVGSPAHAGELERSRARLQEDVTLLTLGDSDLGVDPAMRAAALERVPLGKLQQVADFHPETDRWTERNNRIRITGWMGAWFFSRDLRIKNDMALGFRLNWEVPGFIGIRWDSGFVPWSRMEVKAPAGFGGNPRSSRHMSGNVHAHTLSIGIFNPELSTEGLAFWAGFGAGLWFYSYSESEIFSRGSGINGSFSETNLAGNLFVELSYKVAEIVQVGVGLRQHVILARHTDDGRFYSLNGQKQSAGGGRNDGMMDDLAGVTELTLNVSVLF